MTTITSKDAQNRFGSLLDSVRKDSVTITRHDRPVAVVLSPERYEELEALEDAIWMARAKKAAKSGYLTKEETMEFIRSILDADPDSD